MTRRIVVVTFVALAGWSASVHAGPVAVTVTADSAGEVRARTIVSVPGEILGGDLSITARMRHDRGDPAIAFRSACVGAGPIAFSGLIAELRDPVGRSAATTHWASEPRFRTDIGLTPANRPGAWVATPIGLATGVWDDRATARRSAAAIAGWSSRPVAVAAAVGINRPVDRPGSDVAWFGWTAEQDVAYAAVASGLRLRRVGAGAALGVSRPTLSLPGLWVRIAGATVIVPRGLEARAYLSAVTPSYLDARARTPSRTAIAAAQVKATVGPWSSALSAGLSARWSDRASFVWLPPPEQLHPQSVEGSFTNSVLLRRIDPGVLVGLAVHPDPVPVCVDRSAIADRDASIGFSGRVRAYAELRALAGMLTVTGATTARRASATADLAQMVSLTHRVTASVVADRLSDRAVPGSSLVLRVSLDVDRTASRPLVPAASLRWSLRDGAGEPSAGDDALLAGHDGPVAYGDEPEVQEHWVVPDGYRNDPQSPTYSTSGSRS